MFLSRKKKEVNGMEEQVEEQTQAEDATAEMEEAQPEKAEELQAEEQVEEAQETSLPAAEIAERCMKAQCAELITRAISEGYTEAQLEEGLKYAKDVKEACSSAKLGKLADAFIRMGIPVQDIREALADKLADESEQNDVSSHVTAEEAARGEEVNPVLADVERRRAEFEGKKAK